MKKNKNGFTLVELLLVVAILAIVIAITIPMVAEITDSSKRKAFYLYGLNLVSKGTEKYIQTYSNLDNFRVEDFNDASCVVYNIKEDLNIKNTGNYEGWVRVKRSAPKTSDVNTKVATVKLQVDHIPTDAENEEYNLRNGKYIDGLLYPKYCITSETSCNPNQSLNVQENQYYMEVNKTIHKGETLCANFSFVNSSNTVVEKAPQCTSFDSADANILPSDYTYEVVIAYKDNSFAVQNVNMEGMKEQDFKDKLKEEIEERNKKDFNVQMEIYKPVCGESTLGYDPDIKLGSRTYTPAPHVEVTEKPVREDVLLETLTVSGYDIGFNPGQSSYSLEVPNTVTSVKVYAKAKKDTTKLTYDQNVNLAIGRNVITVTLEGEDGETNRYNIYINRLNSNTTRTTVSTTTTTRSTMTKSVVVYTTRSITTKPGAPDPSLPESNAQLEFLTISKHQDFEFNPDVYYYDLKLDKDEDMLYLNYRAKNPGATVIVTGNSNLKNGSQVEILVRSENEYYTNSYIINVYREQSAISYTLLFRVLAIVLGIVLAVVLIWLTLTRRSMRPKKGKQIQVITKTTQNGPSTSVFDSQPKKVVVNTNQNNNDNNNNPN